MKPKGIIFVVEDDKFYNSLVTTFIKQKGYFVQSFYSGEEIIQYTGNTVPDIILLDYLLTGINGLDTMRKIKPQYPNTEFILVSGQTEIKVALDAIHNGAYDYIIKDNNAKDTALNKIEQILKFRKIVREKAIYKKSIILIASILVISWLVVLFFIFRK
jgi:DNA-binding NtrC family response regulator